MEAACVTRHQLSHTIAFVRRVSTICLTSLTSHATRDVRKDSSKLWLALKMEFYGSRKIKNFERFIVYLMLQFVIWKKIVDLSFGMSSLGEIGMDCTTLGISMPNMSSTVDPALPDYSNNQGEVASMNCLYDLALLIFAEME